MWDNALSIALGILVGGLALVAVLALIGKAVEIIDRW